MQATATRTLATLLAMVVSTSVLADKVKSIDVRASGINMNDGVVRVQPVNGQYQNIQNNKVEFHVEAKASCANNWNVNSLNVIYGSTDCDGKVCEGAGDQYYVDLGKGGEEVPWRKANMQVPMAQLGVDPVALCQQMLEQKQQQGASVMQILNSEHVINRQVTISTTASCTRGNRIRFGDDAMKTNLRVVCMAGGNGLPNQVQAPKPAHLKTAENIGGGYQPLTINTAFMAIENNSLHYQGQCPTNINFKVNLQGSGKGWVRYHIVENGDKNFVSTDLAFNSASLTHNFQYPLELNQAKLNQKQNRSFAIYVELKDQKAEEFSWSKHGSYTPMVWSFTCTPTPVANGPGSKLAQPVQPTPKPGYVTSKAQPVPPAATPPRAPAPAPVPPRALDKSSPKLQEAAVARPLPQPMPRPAPQAAPQAMGKVAMPQPTQPAVPGDVTEGDDGEAIQGALDRDIIRRIPRAPKPTPQ